jgi:hypothetical protein
MDDNICNQAVMVGNFAFIDKAILKKIDQREKVGRLESAGENRHGVGGESPPCYKG